MAFSHPNEVSKTKKGTDNNSMKLLILSLAATRVKKLLQLKSNLNLVFITSLNEEHKRESSFPDFQTKNCHNWKCFIVTNSPSDKKYLTKGDCKWGEPIDLD